ncbi:MAG: hypothetical protein O8C63_08850 [Candidatus Methanoperedens sp.]|nr:hypothetical protein [Candidatus Methanoperedens sp.]
MPSLRAFAARMLTPRKGKYGAPKGGTTSNTSQDGRGEVLRAAYIKFSISFAF